MSNSKQQQCQAMTIKWHKHRQITHHFLAVSDLYIYVKIRRRMWNFNRLLILLLFVMFSLGNDAICQDGH